MIYCNNCNKKFKEPLERHVAYGDGQLDLELVCPNCESMDWCWTIDIPEEERRKNMKPTKKTTIALIALIIGLIILAAIGPLVNAIQGTVEKSRVKEAVLAKKLDDYDNEDYLIWMEKMDVRSSEHPDAHFWFIYIYTEEDGYWCYNARYEDGKAEVFPS